MKKVLGCVMVFFLSIALYAQRADFITTLIESEYATCGDVSYLYAIYQGIIEENATYKEAAVQALKDRGQLSKSAKSEDILTFSELAKIVANIYEVKGGLMYRLTKGSGRYALRQLKLDGVIPNNVDPSQKLSGVDVLNIYTMCERIYGGEE